MEQGLHLGGQIYVSRRGEIVADGAFGETRPGEPMQRDHLVLWLSATKPVGAVAIAQLWERGRLELDDPVARHLPEFGVHGKEKITLRHLLTHTAGVRLLDVGWPRISWDEVVTRICESKIEPGWVVGEKAGYHLASSWFLLGEIIRRIDGRPFELYVRAEIFEPLGMLDSWIGMPVARFAAYGSRIAPTFNTEGGKREPRGWDSEARVTACSPGGNGRGPIHELGRFYEMLLAGGRLGDVRLLLPQTVEALTARHRVGMLDHTFRHVLDWGLGVIVNSRHYGVESAPYGYGPHASRRTFGHSGFRSSTGFADPEHGLAVALAVNGTPDEAQHHDRFDELSAALYEDLGLAG